VKRSFLNSVLKGTVTMAAVVLLVTPALEAETTYGFQTIDNNNTAPPLLGDPNFNQLLGIADSGTIAGYAGDGVVLPNKGYTVVPPYSQTSFTSENFPNSVQTQVVGINSNTSPTTVGFWIDGTGNNFGFVDQNGSFTAVKNPNTPATGVTVNQLAGVNNNNVAAGFYNDAAGNAHGYLYNVATTQFTAIILPASFNAVSVTATGVNNSGVVSGFYLDTAGNTHGFLDNAGSFTSYDDPNGNLTNTMFLGLNNNNQVVGSFVGTNGVTNGLVFNVLTNTFQTVDDPNQSSTAAFNVTGTTINGINDLGQLVGFYSDGTKVNGVLATATPEPASVGFIALAGVLAITIGGWRRRQRKA
jgi:hypothetical protein